MIKLDKVELRKIPKLGESVETEGILWRSPVICLACTEQFQLWRIKGHTRWDEEKRESVVEQAEYVVVLVRGKTGKIIYSETPGRQWHNRKAILERVIEILARTLDDNDLNSLVKIRRIESDDDENLKVIVEWNED